MTEHISSQIDLEAETIIDLTDLTRDDSPQPVEASDAEAEATIDLTTDTAETPTETPVEASDAERDAPVEQTDDDRVVEQAAELIEQTDDDRVVEQAAELIEQIDAEVEAEKDAELAAAAEESDQLDERAVAHDAATPEPAAEEAAPPGPEIPLRRVLEAVLMIAEDPLPVVEIASRLEVPVPEVATAISELAAEYEQQERGFALREVAGGWRYYTAAECAPAVERFLLAGQTSRLSQAALETLAVVAYQQPVSRSRIAAVRGVSVDGVMKTLVTRGLIAESGTDAESGAIMYVTTPKFLERLGLRDLSELPPLAPLLPGLDELPEE